MSGIMNIGLRSLIAYQTAIQTAAQNLENARTPFYSRRQITFVESMFNGGVQIADVRRVFDEVSNKSLLKSSSALNNVSKYLEGISDLQKILDSDSSSINKYLNDSLSSLQDLSKDVNSPQMRGAYLAKLSNIANQFRNVGADIVRKKDDLNQSMANTVNLANDLLGRISKISTQISETRPEERSTLLDQRNALTHELAQYLNFNTSNEEGDGLTITLANGLELLSGSICGKLSTQPDPNDTTKLKIMLTTGNNISDATPNITGGQIGGMMRYRADALDTAERGLGRLSLVLSSIFNKQNQLGADLNGNIGGNIFTDINDSSMKSTRVLASTKNVGSGNIAVDITNPGQLTASDYSLVFSDATHYSLKRLSDNSIVSTGDITSYPATISVDGMTTTITSGSFSAGDVFTLKPTSYAMQGINMAITDPNKLALAFPVSANANVNNSGLGKINVDAIIDTTNPAFAASKQLSPPINIVFLSDTTYQLVDANTNAVIEGPVTYDPATSTSVFPTPGGYDPGYRISLSGSMKAGDSFSIGYNTNVTGDNRNALQFTNLYTDKFIDNGRLSFNDAYHQVAGDISMKTNMATSELESAMSIYNQADLRFNQISGVSDIEEMSNLSQYQESYQACAQVLQVARTIFDTIIGLTR